MHIQTNQTQYEESNNQERTHSRERPLRHLNKVDGMSMIQLNKREKGNMLVKYIENNGSEFVERMALFLYIECIC